MRYPVNIYSYWPSIYEELYDLLVEKEVVEIFFFGMFNWDYKAEVYQNEATDTSW